MRSQQNLNWSVSSGSCLVSSYEIESTFTNNSHYAKGKITDTAGLLVRYMHTKNQFADEPEGLRQFRDHREKALSKENPRLL